MNVSSYNITDIAYHYIGLRVLASLSPTARRDEQTRAISRSVLQYVMDRALRLMLPEPKGTFETIGEKVCQELVHFQFARSSRAGYDLTEAGKEALGLLDGHRNVELRRLMAAVHLQTYENVRTVVQRHMEVGAIWRPIVGAGQHATLDYIQRLLRPTFQQDADQVAGAVLGELKGKGPKKLEDALQGRVVERVFPTLSLSVPLFRSLCDRLTTLRLVNIRKLDLDGCEFAKSYSPCVPGAPPDSWHVRVNVPLAPRGTFVIYLSEPNMEDEGMQKELRRAIDEAFAALHPQAGYYDLPAVRDYVCELLKIPEAAFDDGVNRLLDEEPATLTVALRYEGISARRKPLLRNRGGTQIYNLIRRG